MIVLDTNVLAYAVGADHALRKSCADMIAAVRDGRTHAVTSHFVIQEFAHIRARRFPRSNAVALARNFAVLLGPLLTVDDDVLDRGLKLFERYELDAFDALLAGAALEAKADALVSADAGFAQIARLRHVVPGTPEFDALIA